jgi:hypothetical protein
MLRYKRALPFYTDFELKRMKPKARIYLQNSYRSHRPTRPNTMVFGPPLKLTVIQLVTKFHAFIETGGSLPSS